MKDAILFVAFIVLLLTSQSSCFYGNNQLCWSYDDIQHCAGKWGMK